MSSPRPTQKESRELKQAERRKEIERDIAEGRLVVRQMTSKERKEADAHRAAGAEDRARRKRARG